MRARHYGVALRREANVVFLERGERDRHEEPKPDPHAGTLLTLVVVLTWVVIVAVISWLIR